MNVSMICGAAATVRHLRDIRLSEGVSVFQLASNMGTSVEMIEKLTEKTGSRPEDGDRTY